MDQNSRYKNAVGRPNIASKVGTNELKSPLAMGGRARSVSESNAGLLKRRTSSASIGRANAFATAEDSIAPRKSNSMGSAAGFRGEKSAHLEVNGGGYMGATKRSYAKTNLNSTSGAVFDARNFKQSFSNKVSGRLARTSKMKMGQIKSLSRLV